MLMQHVNLKKQVILILKVVFSRTKIYIKIQKFICYLSINSKTQDKFKKKIISIKIKNEELAYSNNLPKYLSKLYRGGNLDKFYLEKSTLNRIIEDKKKRIEVEYLDTDLESIWKKT